MSKKLKFSVSHTGEPDAGIHCYYNTITVCCDADPGGESDEFSAYILGCLSEWFDGAKVEQIRHAFDTYAHAGNEFVASEAYDDIDISI